MWGLIINSAVILYLVGFLILDRRHWQHPIGHLITIGLLIFSVWQLHDSVNKYYEVHHAATDN